MALSARCRSPPKHLLVGHLAASLPHFFLEKITAITKILEKIAEMTQVVEKSQKWKNYRNERTNCGKITDSKLSLSLGLLGAWPGQTQGMNFVIDFILASEKKSSRWPNGHSGLVGKSRWCFLKPQYEHLDVYDLIPIWFCIKMIISMFTNWSWFFITMIISMFTIWSRSCPDMIIRTRRTRGTDQKQGYKTLSPPHHQLCKMSFYILATAAQRSSEQKKVHFRD